MSFSRKKKHTELGGSARLVPTAAAAAAPGDIGAGAPALCGVGQAVQVAIGECAPVHNTRICMYLWWVNEDTRVCVCVCVSRVFCVRVGGAHRRVDDECSFTIGAGAPALCGVGEAEQIALGECAPDHNTHLCRGGG